MGRPQLERLDNQLSDRDRAVLMSLAQHRFLTTDQLTRFHFLAGDQVASTATRRCRRVLTRLSGLQVIESLGRRVGGFRAGSTTHIWCLGLIGDRLLRLGSNRPRARRKAPSLRHLEHCLAIADTHLSLQSIPGHDLTELHTEPACWRSYRRPDHTAGTLKPDLYAVTVSGEFEDHWFIEVDRATESLPVLLGKCAQYRDYHHAGLEQQRLGIFPRVIWVVPTEQRDAHLSVAIQRADLPAELFRTGTLPQLPGIIRGGAA